MFFDDCFAVCRAARRAMALPVTFPECRRCTLARLHAPLCGSFFLNICGKYDSLLF